MSKRTVVFVLAAAAVVIVFGVVQAQGQAYALDRPTLTATEVEGEIVLSWTEVEGATRYGLWVKDCENRWERIGDGDWETTEAVHRDPVDGRTYKYTVQALNDRGEESDWASRREDRYLWVRETVNPIPFPQFEIVPQADHIRLQFAAVEEAVGYQGRVWYAGAGDRWLALPEPDLESRTFSWFEVEAGVEYFFMVRSYSENMCGYSDWTGYQMHTFAGDVPTPVAGTPVPTTTDSLDPGGNGNGGNGNGGDGDGGDGDGVTGAADTATPTATGTATSTPTATGTPTPRPLPGRVSFTGKDSTHNSVTVYWNAPDPTAVEYVLRGSLHGGSYETIYIGSGTQYTWSGRDANTRYQFAIYGRNSPAFPDWGPWSYTISAWTKVAPDALATSVPGQPQSLTASNVANGVKLSWSHHSQTNTGSNWDEGAITEHEISRRRGSDRWQVIVASGRRTSYTDKNVYAGNTYTYRVRARNRHGYSSPATVVLTFVPGTPEPTPVPEPTAEPDCSEIMWSGKSRDANQCTADEQWCAAQAGVARCGHVPDICLKPDGTEFDRCTSGGATCSNPQWDALCRCGTTECEGGFCGEVTLHSLESATHLLLHEKMAFDEVVGVLHGVDWMEFQQAYARLMYDHPYYVLNERHILSKNHARHEHHARHERK